MNENLEKKSKSRKIKTPEELLEFHLEKVEKLKAKVKKEKDKKIIDIFSFLFEDRQLLEKLNPKEFREKNDFETKFKEFVTNLGKENSHGRKTD